MDTAPGSRPSGRSTRHRPALVVVAVLVVLLGLGGLAMAARTGGQSQARWQEAPAGPAATGTAAPSPSAPARTVSLSATGDIIMGNAPDRLPASGGKGFFKSVREALKADLVMGNLEQPLTEDTGTAKCLRPPPSPSPGASPGPSPTPIRISNCFQFRLPPSYAAHLRDAGFDVLNLANNHGHDFGPAGYRNTQQALEEHGLEHTGAPDQITVVDVDGVSVAVVGFSAYSWSNSLTDIGAAKRLVRKAAGQADLVVVQAHMGAEGEDKRHVTPGPEIFFGENRGDPIRFSRAVVDAGADLVVGHGPHVLRGMEFYKGRLIAYSLGNFAGGRMLSNDGRKGWGGVLKVSLTPDGEWSGGQFLSTVIDGSGKPVRDTEERGRGLIGELSAEDFPETGVRFADDGSITAPAAQ